MPVAICHGLAALASAFGLTMTTKITGTGDPEYTSLFTLSLVASTVVPHAGTSWAIFRATMGAAAMIAATIYLPYALDHASTVRYLQVAAFVIGVLMFAELRVRAFARKV